MSVYQEKIYPEIISPSAPPENRDQSYRLTKIDEAEKLLQSKMKERDKLTKRFKRRANAATISDTSVITSITALEVASIATMTTGIGITVSIVLASTGLLLGLGSIVIHKSHKVFESKAKKTRQN